MNINRDLDHPLDKPVWRALRSRQAGFASEGDLARRFAEDVSPLAGACDDSAQAVLALVALIPRGEDISLLERAPPRPPSGVVASQAPCLQMTLATFSTGGSEAQVEAVIEPLSDRDAREMLALATLTRPGPFRRRTHSLGRFVGCRDGGRLVAMAGERMRLDGLTEISAVCTHPDYRGRGYAEALMRVVGARILEEGDTPFLHCYAANTGAIALYRRLGFKVRREVVHAVWKRG